MSATLNRLTDTFATFDVSADVASGTVAVVTGAGTGHVRVSQRAEKSGYGIGTWLLAAGVVAAVAVGALRLQALRSAELAPAESAADAVPVVNITRPAPAGAADVELPATVRPWQTSDLHARVSGYLTAWHFDLGAPVQAGDLLAEIETPELDQELAEGEALASEAAAAVVQAKAERAEARADLKVAEAQLARIQAESELAKSQLARREKLLATRAIARDDYETFSTQVDARTAEVAAAQADVVRRRTNLETRSAIIAVREATAKSRRANAERLRELQAFKRIVAPFAGVVTHRTAEVGMLVTAGKESLFTVEDLSRVRVQVHVPQAYALHTAPGAQAVVNIAESSLPAIEGTITRSAWSVDAASRTMLAEIELDNAAHRYHPGSYAQVTLTAGQDASGWTIPTSTVSMKVEGPHVAVLDEHDQVELRRVKLGRDLGSRVVVSQGIRGDERLIVNPADTLGAGTRVRASGEAPPPAVAQR